MDETAAKARLERSGKHSPLQKLEVEVAELAVKKDEAIREQKFEEAARLRKKEQAKRDKLEKLRQKVEVEAKREFVAAITDEDIAEVVSQRIAPTRDWTRRSRFSRRSFHSSCS